MSNTPCLSECNHLKALAKRLQSAVQTAGGDAAFLRAWFAQANALANSPTLETAEGDRALDVLALNLRNCWLQYAYAQSGPYLMTPPQGQRKLLPVGERIGYPYDRWIKPRVLEERLNAMRPPPRGWSGRAIVFANGMAALGATLQMYRSQTHKMWKRPPGPLSLHWFGGYFEIIKLLQLVCDDFFHGRKHANQHDLCRVVEQGSADLVLIEPVAADISLAVFDLNAFIAAWQRRTVKRPCTIVIDASLSGPVFPVEKLCQALRADPPAMVVIIRSGLKLDQQGLELANVGLLHVWLPDTPNDAKRLERIEERFKTTRTTLGVGVSQDEYAALTVPFFLDQPSLVQHTEHVFANNRRFAQALAPTVKANQGLIAEISHPCLGPSHALDWAQAPFVTVRYRGDENDARAFMRTVLEFESRTRKLSFVPGSSFGFRGHRFEMGFSGDLKHTTLRVALGARVGPSVEGIIKLFQDLSAYPDFAALRHAYPQLAKDKPKDRVDEES